MRALIGAGLVVGWGVVVASPVEIVATATNALAGPAMAVALLGVVDAVRRKTAIRPALVVAALWAGLVGIRTLRSARPAARASGPELTVISYNVLFKGGDARASLALLEDAQADVVLLQEVTPAWAERLASGRLGRFQRVAPHRGTHGLAVLSRHPLSNHRIYRNGGGGIIGQCVDVAVNGGVGVCHVHLASPSGAVTQATGFADMVTGLEHNARMRLRQWERLEAEMQASHQPIVIAGDFNTLPFERWFVDAQRRWVDAVDSRRWWPGATWPRLPASAHRAPWPIDRLVGSGPWFRIDYVLVDPRVTVRSASRLVGGGSDHLPVRAALSLPATR